MMKFVKLMLVTTAVCGLFAANPAHARSHGASYTTADSTVNTQIRLTHRDVKEIQQRLAAKGFFKSKVDGQLGPVTQEAINDYQASEGIQANGYPTAETLAKLGVNTDNMATAGDNQPAGKGGVVYTESVQTNETTSRASTGSGYDRVNTDSANGSTCMNCTNGPHGNGGTSSMHSNEY